jgi:hypothetical protein
VIDAVILTPKENGRGLHIDLEGRLENVVCLATGEAPMEREGMLQVVAEEPIDPKPFSTDLER